MPNIDGETLPEIEGLNELIDEGEDALDIDEQDFELPEEDLVDENDLDIGELTDEIGDKLGEIELPTTEKPEGTKPGEQIKSKFNKIKDELKTPKK